MKYPIGSGGRMLVLLLILLLLPIAPGVSCAEDIKTVTLPASLETVKEDAFRGDTSLQKVVLQEGTTTIGPCAFADSSLREIALPASLTSIAEDAFLNTPLETVTAPKGTYAYQWARERRYITEYRALLIGETKFLRNNEIESKIRNANDVRKMAAMLSRVYGPTGEQFQITQRSNISSSTIQAAIRNTFAGTMDHDVSLFFIATHGNSNPGGEGDLEMPYNGDVFADNPDYYQTYFSTMRYLPFSTLAEWLSSLVNGKVIVILESCGAGSSIYEGNGAKQGTKSEDELSAEFVQSAIAAFSKADPGIITGPEPKPDSFRKSTGDFRQPKFYVLAAAKHEEESLGEPNHWADPMNLFTRWLIAGVGEKGNSPADADQDNVLTLQELYHYIQYARDHYTGPGSIADDEQHVQVYPEGSDQAIFVLK